MSTILWSKKPVRVTVDITGKSIGDSVHSHYSATDVINLASNHEISLAIKMGDIVAITSNYYYQGSNGLAQVVFLPGLPAIDGTYLSALILSDNEFNLIGIEG